MLTFIFFMISTLSSTQNYSFNIAENNEYSYRDSIYINFDHLEWLNQEVEIEGIPMLITHIYSEFPEYEWVEARNEGIACVDDVSRVALLYLEYFNLYGDSLYLNRARKALNFLMYMEEDGKYYNFVWKDLSINREGRTSKKSFDFWAVRAIRALCYGYRIFTDIDSLYAEKINEHIKKSLPYIKSHLENFNQYEYHEGIKVPGWLIMGGDATSELIIALTDYYSMRRTEEIKEIITRLAEGLVESQVNDSLSSFYGLHFSWKNIWHAWGNAQCQALTRAGHLLRNEEWIESAERCADNFYLHLLSINFLNSIIFHSEKQQEVDTFPQISYGIRPIVSGYIELYRVTGNKKYAILAGISASWLRGNNRAEALMYKSSTGRGFDGIENKNRINMNSGAESTIEALQILIDISKNNIAEEYFYFELNEINLNDEFAIYSGENGEVIKIFRDESTGKYRLDFN